MSLIGKNTEKNAIGLIKIDPTKLSFQDLTPGMTVEVTDKDKKLVRKYIIARRGDCNRDFMLGIDSDNSLVLLTSKDTSSGYSYWSLKDFDKKFPSHYRWQGDLFISNVWMTNINTKNMSTEKLKKIFDETINKLV